MRRGFWQTMESDFTGGLFVFQLTMDDVLVATQKMILTK